MTEEPQACRLRRLTLCDGQRLVQPDHALASCLCWLEERAREAGYRRVAEGAAADRAERSGLAVDALAGFGPQRL